MTTVDHSVSLLSLGSRATEAWGSASLRDPGLLSLSPTNTRYVVLIANFLLPLVLDFVEHRGRWYSFV